TVKSCQVCLANKVQPGPCPGTITQLEAREPFDVVSIDTVGGFSGFGSAKRYWHIALDHHTRYVWAVASSRQAYTDFTNLMSKVLEDGTPKLILTDQYPALTSSTFRSYLEGKGIELAHIPPNSAHSNGRVEPVNLTLTDNLRSCYNDAQNKIKNWAKVASRVVDTYNHSIHGVTKYAPIFLLKGLDPLGIHKTDDLASAREHAF